MEGRGQSRRPLRATINPPVPMVMTAQSSASSRQSISALEAPP